MKYLSNRIYRSALALSGLVAVALLVLLIAIPVRAWDGQGHEQIADIAWTKLTPHAQKRIRAVLFAGDPQFRPADTSEAAVRKAFRHAANFADFIKNNNNTIYETTVIRLNTRWQPNFDPNTTDREAFRCKTWHYYDTPIRYTGNRPAIKESNALTALNFARCELRRLATTDREQVTQAWWLYWILHVTGDLHQPLHCTDNYEIDNKPDAGGNGFPLDVQRGERKINLHGYWDGAITEAINIASPALNTPEAVTAAWTQDAQLVPFTRAVNDLNVADWIANGAKQADTIVYADITRGGKPSAMYEARALRIAKRQAVLAGYRLAAILNSIYD